MTDVRDNALIMPKRALSLESLADSIFVVEDGVAYRRNVTLGYEEDDRVEVTAGLSANDRVIVVGQDGLTDATPVQILVGPGAEEPRSRTADAGSPPGGSGMSEERRAAMRERMRERGMTDEQIDARLAAMETGAGGGPPGEAPRRAAEGRLPLPSPAEGRPAPRRAPAAGASPGRSCDTAGFEQPGPVSEGNSRSGRERVAGCLGASGIRRTPPAAPAAGPAEAPGQGAASTAPRRPGRAAGSRSRSTEAETSAGARRRLRTGFLCEPPSRDSASDSCSSALHGFDRRADRGAGSALVGGSPSADAASLDAEPATDEGASRDAPPTPEQLEALREQLRSRGMTGRTDRGDHRPRRRPPR